MHFRQFCKFLRDWLTMTGRGGRGQCWEIIPSISDLMMTGKLYWPVAQAACVNWVKKKEFMFLCSKKIRIKPVLQTVVFFLNLKLKMGTANRMRITLSHVCVNPKPKGATHKAQINTSVKAKDTALVTAVVITAPWHCCTCDLPHLTSCAVRHTNKAVPPADN